MQQAHLDGAGAHRRKIDPLAVVGHLNNDRIAFASRLDHHLTDFGFPLANPFLDHFEPVIDGVANNMEQGLIESVEDRAIEFEFRTEQLNVNPFALGFGNVTGDPGQIFHHA